MSAASGTCCSWAKQVISITTIPSMASACLHARSIRVSRKSFRTMQSRVATSRPPNNLRSVRVRKVMVGAVAFAALLASMPIGANAATDEQKKDANAVIDKNAQAIWDIGDSIYYFGEMGMQEFESTKLLKDT